MKTLAEPSLPTGLRLVTAAEMAALDRLTIEELGLPGMVLMENAARGAAAFFLKVVPDLPRRRISVVAGSGNNAGDGFALARIFHGMGAVVRVVCLRPPERLRGDALTNFELLEKLRVPVDVWQESDDFDAQMRPVTESEAIIDAILGTGLKNEVQGLSRRVIESLNELDTRRTPVLAVDLPSGLDASTGKPLGAAVQATATATFGCIKVGLVIPPGEDHVGELGVIDIGIPPDLAQQQGIERWWINEDLVAPWMSARPAAVHKGTAGHVAVLAGSRGKTGAAALVCQGAARAGAGLVTLFVPESLNPIMEVKLTEAMTLPVAETHDGSPSLGALPKILHFLEGKQALAVGPGLSLHSESQALVMALLPKVACPMILDADALTAVAPKADVLHSSAAPLVLTPHPGEMARLLGTDTHTVQENRMETASAFSRQYGVVLVLKGHRTVVAAPDGRLNINSSGTPAMASGGTGDTLTGLIAGFLAQGLEPFRAACLGAFVHGMAAESVFGRTAASRGLLASDLLDEIPSVIGKLERCTPSPWTQWPRRTLRA